MVNVTDIQNIQTGAGCPITIINFSLNSPYLIVNDYATIKVERVSNSYDTSNSITIKQNGNEIGTLVFTKDFNVAFNQMTELEFIAFLTDGTFSDYQSSPEYSFKYNYLLLKESFLNSYINDYLPTSSIWGGFAHELPSHVPSTRHKVMINEIETGEILNQLDPYSYESSIRAIEQPYAFERFLKLYHLLELQFDYFTINKIKNLQVPQDSNKIGKLLNEYSHNELSRLTDLIDNHCTDLHALEACLSNVCNFHSIAKDMFIIFGKSSNNLHLTSEDKFNDVLVSRSFSDANLRSLKVHGTNDHEKFIKNLTAYWIYKIRCSIAHNKIGEYILSWNDENFIVEFGEPLIKEVLMQCFKR